MTSVNSIAERATGVTPRIAAVFVLCAAVCGAPARVEAFALDEDRGRRLAVAED